MCFVQTLESHALRCVLVCSDAWITCSAFLSRCLDHLFSVLSRCLKLCSVFLSRCLNPLFCVLSKCLNSLLYFFVQILGSPALRFCPDAGTPFSVFLSRCLDPLLYVFVQMLGHPALCFCLDAWIPCSMFLSRCLDPLLCAPLTKNIRINPSIRLALYSECTAGCSGAVTYQWTLDRLGLNEAWLPIYNLSDYTQGMAYTRQTFKYQQF